MSLSDSRRVLETYHNGGDSPVETFYNSLDASEQILTQEQVEELKRQVLASNSVKLPPKEVDKIIHFVSVSILAYQVSSPTSYSKGAYTNLASSGDLPIRGKALKTFDQISDLVLFLASSYTTYLGARQMAGTMVENASEMMEWDVSPFAAIVAAEFAAASAGIALAEVIRNIKARTREDLLDHPSGGSQGFFKEAQKLFTSLLRKGFGGARGAALGVILVSGLAAADVTLNSVGIVNAVAHRGDKKGQVDDVRKAIDSRVEGTRKALPSLKKQVSGTVSSAITEKLSKERDGEGSTGSKGEGPAFHAIKLINTGAAASLNYLRESESSVAPTLLAIAEKHPGFQVEFEEILKKRSKKIESIIANLDANVETNITATSPIETLREALKDIDGKGGYLASIQSEYNALIKDVKELVEKYNKLEKELADAIIASQKYPNAKAGKVVDVKIPKLKLDTSAIKLKAEFVYKGPEALLKSLGEKKSSKEIALIVALAIIGGFLASYANIMLYPAMVAARRRDLEGSESMNEVIENFIQETSVIISNFLNEGYFADFYTSPDTKITTELVSDVLYKFIDSKAANAISGPSNSAETITTNARAEVLRELLEFSSAQNFLLDFFQELFPGDVTSKDRVKRNDHRVAQEQQQFDSNNENVQVALDLLSSRLDEATTTEEGRKILDSIVEQVVANSQLSSAQKDDFRKRAYEIIDSKRNILREKENAAREEERRLQEEKDVKDARFVDQLLHSQVTDKVQEFKEFILPLDTETPEAQLYEYFYKNNNTVAGDDYWNFVDFLIRTIPSLVNRSMPSFPEENKENIISTTVAALEAYKNKYNFDVQHNIDDIKAAEDEAANKVPFSHRFVSIKDQPEALVRDVPRVKSTIRRMVAAAALGIATLVAGQATLGNNPMDLIAEYTSKNSAPKDPKPTKEKAPEKSVEPIVPVKAEVEKVLNNSKEFTIEKKGKNYYFYDGETKISKENIDVKSVKGHVVLTVEEGQYKLPIKMIKRSANSNKPVTGEKVE